MAAFRIRCGNKNAVKTQVSWHPWCCLSVSLKLLKFACCTHTGQDLSLRVRPVTLPGQAWCMTDAPGHCCKTNKQWQQWWGESEEWGYFGLQLLSFDLGWCSKSRHGWTGGWRESQCSCLSPGYVAHMPLHVRLLASTIPFHLSKSKVSPVFPSQKNPKVMDHTEMQIKLLSQQCLSHHFSLLLFPGKCVQQAKWVLDARGEKFLLVQLQPTSPSLCCLIQTYWVKTVGTPVASFQKQFWFPMNTWHTLAMLSCDPASNFPF